MRSEREKRILYLNIGCRNQKKASFKYEPRHWRLCDVEGRVFKQIVYYELDKVWEMQYFHARSLAPTQEARGWIAFIIADDTKPDYIHYEETFRKIGRADFLIDRTVLPFRERPKQAKKIVNLAKAKPQRRGGLSQWLWGKSK